MPMPVKFLAEVVSILRHDQDVATYLFRCLMPRPRWKPGQFLHLALDPYDPSGHWPESRCFTMASGSLEKELVRLTIAAKGTFTRRILAELQPGRKVWMKAPYGDFIVRTSAERDVVLIAGGTGITPFVAFMEDALVKGLVGKVWLHYGARSPDLLVFREFAERCARRFSAFRVDCYAETGAAGATIAGRIDLQRAVLKAEGGRPEDENENSSLILHPSSFKSAATYYLCGPQEMINAFRARLTGQFGVPESNVKIDAWE
jgi:ferredoxin-NADP reductase